MERIEERNEWDVAEIRERTIAGVSWTIVAQAWNQGSQFVVSVILARLLTPSDFGLVGMIMVFTGFAALFGGTGFCSALIQRQGLQERHYSTIFWFNVILGLLLTLAFVAGAPLVSRFYNEPKLAVLTRLLSVNFLIGSFGMVQGAMLNRTMGFRAIAIIQIAVGTVSGAAGIGMALTGFGVWSLVVPRLLTSPIDLFFLWSVTRWHPKAIFDRSALKELLGFGSSATAVGILNYWERNADNLLVGKFLGTSALGIYSRAYSTMLLPVSQVWGVLSKVMFSALSRLQDDRARTKDIYLRCLSMIALVTFPMMMGLLCVADHFVLAVYGAKWAAVVRVLQILSLVGMLQSLGTTIGWIFQSQGRAGWMLKWEIAAGAITIIGFLIGVRIGTIEAMAWSYAATNIVLIYWSFVVVGKLIDMAVREVVASVLGSFWCSAAMAGAVYAIGLALPGDWPDWMFLAVQVPFGAAFYASIVRRFNVKAYREFRALLSERVTSPLRSGNRVVPGQANPARGPERESVPVA